jgi:hypothetical protein
MSAEHSVGARTRFVLTLPLGGPPAVDLEAAKACKSSATAQAVNGHGPKAEPAPVMLVVEDENDIRRFVRTTQQWITGLSPADTTTVLRRPFVASPA